MYICMYTVHAKRCGRLGVQVQASVLGLVQIGSSCVLTEERDASSVVKQRMHSNPIISYFLSPDFFNT